MAKTVWIDRTGQHDCAVEVRTVDESIGKTGYKPASSQTNTLIALFFWLLRKHNTFSAVEWNEICYRWMHAWMVIIWLFVVSQTKTKQPVANRQCDKSETQATTKQANKTSTHVKINDPVTSHYNWHVCCLQTGLGIEEESAQLARRNERFAWMAVGALAVILALTWGYTE